MLIFILTLAFLASWIALYIVVIRPKLVSFRYTAGIYAKLDSVEAGWLSSLSLRLKGAKVFIIAAITSAAPIVSVGWDQVASADISAFATMSKADLLKFGLGVTGPMLMAALHQGALADASASTPVALPSTVPPATA